MQELQPLCRKLESRADHTKRIGGIRNTREYLAEHNGPIRTYNYLRTLFEHHAGAAGKHIGSWKRKWKFDRNTGLKKEIRG